MQNLNQNKKKRTVPPVIVTLAYLCAMIAGGFIPPMLLLTYCAQLGIWWSILLFVHITILCFCSGWSIYRREVTKLRVMLGNEGLYEIYPRERRRDERRAERAKARAARKKQRKLQSRGL